MSNLAKVFNFLRLYFSATVYFTVSGLCLGIGFIVPSLWVAVFPGLVLFLIGLKQVSSVWQAGLGGFIVFTIKSLLAIAWFWSVYPILWIDLGLEKAELFVIGFYWFTVSVFIGVAGFFCATLLWSVSRYIKKIWLIILTPLVFVSAEILGSFSFSLFTYKEGIEPNMIFSFGYLGYLLAEHEWFIQLASLGGVYVLTFTVVMGGLALWYWLEKYNYGKNSLKVTLLTLILIALSSNLDFYKSNDGNLPQRGIKVAIVDTKFGGADYFKLEDRESYRVSQMVEAIAAALETMPDYVVMPEDSRYINYNLSPKASYALFRFQQSDPDTVIIEAGPFNLGEGNTALRATIYDGVNKKVYATDKQYLVPQGEFMPNFYKYILSLVGLGQYAKFLDSKFIYRSGPLNTQFDLPSNIPGILFCFSSVDPLSVRKMVKERELLFIAHTVSHAWFNESAVLRHQLDSMIRIQAIWNRMSIISAGNMVPGSLYSVQGQKIVPTLSSEGEAWQVSLITI